MGLHRLPEEKGFVFFDGDPSWDKVLKENFDEGLFFGILGLTIVATYSIGAAESASQIAFLTAGAALNRLRSGK